MSERAFVDRRVGDVDLAQGAADVAAARWQLPTPTLLRHGMNVIYRCGDVVLRVAEPSAPAGLAIELSDVLADAGLSVVRPARREVVQHETMSVTAWDFIESSGAAIDWRAVGRQIAMVHRLDADDLPEGLPQPSPASFPWWHFTTLLDDVDGALDDQALAGIMATLDRWQNWAVFDDAVICHGDVHPGNVIMGAKGPVLIDWDLLCVAPRGWDHAPMMTWTSHWGGEPGVYDALADGYGWTGRGEPSAEAFAELRLVAATLMRVKAGLADPAAMPEAQRRLAYWRGDADAGPWRAQ